MQFELLTEGLAWQLTKGYADPRSQSQPVLTEAWLKQLSCFNVQADH